MMVVQHEDVVAPVDEVDHHLLQLALGHLAVADRDARPLGRELARRASPARAMSSTRLWTKNTWPPRASSRLIASPSSGAIPAADEGADRQPVGGRRGDDRDLAQPAHRHLQRARDRRRGQRQHVDLRAQLLEPLLVGDAEALLLVDDQQAEVLEAHVARQQRGGCRRRRRACPPPAPPPSSAARPCCGSATARRRAPGSRAKRSEKVTKCCSASTVVGASTATCLPPSTASRLARSATSVLP